MGSGRCSKRRFLVSMKPDEKVEEYIYRAEYLYGQLKDAGINGIDEATLVSKLVTGLPRRYMYFMSNWTNMDDKNLTIEELLPRLMAEDSLLSKFKSMSIGNAMYGEANGYHPDGSKRKNEPWKKKKKRDDDTPKPKEGKKKEAFDINKIKCFGCGKMGHFSSHCHDTDKSEDKSKNSMDKEEPQAIVAVSNQVWLLDSDSSHHMTDDNSYFVSYHEYKFPRTIRYGGSNHGQALGVGNMVVASNESETRYL